jgi:hypothetical protein
MHRASFRSCGKWRRVLPKLCGLMICAPMICAQMICVRMISVRMISALPCVPDLSVPIPS